MRHLEHLYVSFQINHNCWVYFFNSVSQKVMLVLISALCFFGWQNQSNAEDKTSTETFEPSAKVSVSTGATYLDFNQTFASGANKNLRFEGVDIPNFSVLFETTVSESSYLKVTFLRYTPSSTDSNGSTTVKQKTLGISTLGIDYNYLPFLSSTRGYLKKMGVTGGFQFSSLPLLNRTGPSTVSADVFWDLFLKFGLVNTFSLSKKMSLTTSATYVLPINFLSEFQVSAATLLEAEFLLSRQLNQRWDIGLGWQFRKHSYEITGRVLDLVTNQPFRAQQSNMYSILYFQTGYRW